ESSIPKISEKILPEVNALTTPIPVEDVSMKCLNGNSSDDSFKIGPVAVSTSSVSQVISSKKSRLPISILAEDLKE
ncbi:6787_t:CDS:1, partial [Funneliformis geosporum]